MTFARVIGAALGVAILIAMGAASRVSYRDPHADSAIIRLSWRMRGERIQQCRDRTPEELAGLPAHMRAPQVCTGRNASFKLTVEIDAQRTERQIRASGARADRPVYVFHEVRVRPGAHDVAVTFTNADAEQAPLTFTQRVSAEAGRIHLITYNADRRQLELR